MYLASALASISLSRFSSCVFQAPESAAALAPTPYPLAPLLCRLRGLLRRCFRGVTLERPRGRELAQLVADHVLRDVHRDELRQNGRTPRPRPHHFLLVLVVHRAHLLHQVIVDKRPLS